MKERIGELDMQFDRFVICTFALLGGTVFSGASTSTNTRIPVFDIEASVMTKVEGGATNVHLFGSFRIKQKTDFDLTTENIHFYFTPELVSPSSPKMPLGFKNGLPRWTELSAGSMHVAVASNSRHIPVTEAIVRFDFVVTEPDIVPKLLQDKPQGAVAVMMFGTADEREWPNPTIVASRNEWSFAVCSLSAEANTSLDANTIVPITLYQPQSKYAIGASDDLWLHDILRHGWNAYMLDCTPQVFTVTPGSLSAPFPADQIFNLAWTLKGVVSGTGGKRKQGPLPSVTTGDYVLIYAPDFSDYKGRRLFQISGVIRV